MGALRVLSAWQEGGKANSVVPKGKQSTPGRAESPNYPSTSVGTQLAVKMQGGDAGSSSDNALQTAAQSSFIIGSNEELQGAKEGAWCSPGRRSQLGREPCRAAHLGQGQEAGDGNAWGCRAASTWRVHQLSTFQMKAAPREQPGAIGREPGAGTDCLQFPAAGREVVFGMVHKHSAQLTARDTTTGTGGALLVSLPRASVSSCLALTGLEASGCQGDPTKVKFSTCTHAQHVGSSLWLLLDLFLGLPGPTA